MYIETTETLQQRLRPENCLPKAAYVPYTLRKPAKINILYPVRDGLRKNSIIEREPVGLFEISTENNFKEANKNFLTSKHSINQVNILKPPAHLVYMVIPIKFLRPSSTLKIFCSFIISMTFLYQPKAL